MLLDEKQAIEDANETLIERFEKEAANACTEADEYTALGLLDMITRNYEQLKKTW